MPKVSYKEISEKEFTMETNKKKKGKSVSNDEWALERAQEVFNYVMDVITCNFFTNTDVQALMLSIATSIVPSVTDLQHIIEIAKHDEMNDFECSLMRNINPSIPEYLQEGPSKWKLKMYYYILLSANILPFVKGDNNQIYKGVKDESSPENLKKMYDSLIKSIKKTITENRKHIDPFACSIVTRSMGNPEYKERKMSHYYASCDRLCTCPKCQENGY